MKIALIGYGQMNRAVERLALEAGHEIHARVDAEHDVETIAGSDVAIDFSTGPAVPRNVAACLDAGVPLVEGTTAWRAERDAVVARVSQRGGALVIGDNFSLGVNLFYRIAAHAAELMAQAPYEPFLEEAHHARKVDAPSGTALVLRDLVAGATGREVPVASTRAGHVPGTHRVGFDGAADEILLTHRARSRDGFASGALLAAEWLIGKAGVFEFPDVVDEVFAVGGRVR